MVVHYHRGGVHFVLKIFQLRGSVFPFAFMVAFPNALLTVAIKILVEQASWDYAGRMPLEDSAVWSGFSFLVGFLIVFRTSEAYGRFWSGCTHLHKMRAEWFDACASTIAFCKHSDAPHKQIVLFQHLLVRLFSMLHAMALAEIEDNGGEDHDPESVNALGFPVLDLGSIDEASLASLRTSVGKVELVYQWVQQTIVEQIKTGVMSIPPPILSRAFNELANGMVEFHEALKLSDIPFPFPYAQTCDSLLLMHWLAAPFVVAQWVSAPWWAACFSFMQVFILWTLNGIAVEIENPFGLDPNDIDGCEMQVEMNAWLSQLIAPAQSRTPELTAEAKNFLASPLVAAKSLHRLGSFQEIWTDLESETAPTTTIGRGNAKIARSQSNLSGAGVERKVSKGKESGGKDMFGRRRPSRRQSDPQIQVEQLEADDGDDTLSFKAGERLQCRRGPPKAEGDFGREASRNSRNSGESRAHPPSAFMSEATDTAGQEKAETIVAVRPDEMADASTGESFKDVFGSNSGQHHDMESKHSLRSIASSMKDAPLPGMPDARRSFCSPPASEPPLINGLPNSLP